jgi:hypothetical protein
LACFGDDASFKCRHFVPLAHIPLLMAEQYFVALSYIRFTGQQYQQPHAVE